MSSEPELQKVTNFRIASWNLMMSVGTPIRYNGAQERSSHFAPALYASSTYRQKPIDIICFQELTVFKEKVLESFVHHRWQTSEVSSSLFGKKPRVWPAGLVTVSSFPIEKEAHFIFNGPAYHIEKFVAKGMLYTKIRLSASAVVHVCNIHLNAWSTPQARDARKHQIQEICCWIQGLNLPQSEPVLLIGDFNIDWYESGCEVESICRTLRARPFRIQNGFMFTFDGQENPLVGLDAPEEYVLTKTGQGCYEDILETGKCSCCPRQLLDGCVEVQWSSSSSPLTLRNSSVVRVLAMSPYELNMNFWTKKVVQDVSDHYTPVYDFEIVCRATAELEENSRKQGWHHPVQRDAQFESRLFLAYLFAVMVLAVVLSFAVRRWRSSG